jgi:hypothetical protein
MKVVNCLTEEVHTVENLRKFLIVSPAQPITLDLLISKGYLLIVTLDDIRAFHRMDNRYAMFMDSEAAFKNIQL